MGRKGRLHQLSGLTKQSRFCTVRYNLDNERHVHCLVIHFDRWWDPKSITLHDMFIEINTFYERCFKYKNLREVIFRLVHIINEHLYTYIGKYEIGYCHQKCARTKLKLFCFPCSYLSLSFKISWVSYFCIEQPVLYRYIFNRFPSLLMH